jgi:hypothetical protein
MPKPSVAPEIHQPLDVHLDLAPQIAFDLELGFEKIADPLDFTFRQFLGHLVRCDARLLADAASRGATHAVEVREREYDVLVTRKVDASDASHM